MKVSELIEKLKEFDPELELIVWGPGGEHGQHECHYFVEDLIIDDWGDNETYLKVDYGDLEVFPIGDQCPIGPDDNKEAAVHVWEPEAGYVLKSL